MIIRYNVASYAESKRPLVATAKAGHLKSRMVSIRSRRGIRPPNSTRVPSKRTQRAVRVLARSCALHKLRPQTFTTLTSIFLSVYLSASYFLRRAPFRRSNCSKSGVPDAQGTHVS